MGKRQEKVIVYLFNASMSFRFCEIWIKKFECAIKVMGNFDFEI